MAKGVENNLVMDSKLVKRIIKNRLKTAKEEPHYSGDEIIEDLVSYNSGYIAALEILLNDIKEYENIKSKEICKHYDREEINFVLDGKTLPVIRCRVCGRRILTNGE